jgi:hypothetical protein
MITATAARKTSKRSRILVGLDFVTNPQHPAYNRWYAAVTVDGQKFAHTATAAGSDGYGECCRQVAAKLNAAGYRNVQFIS